MYAKVMCIYCIKSTGATNERTITLDNTETVRIEFIPGRDGQPGPRGPPGPVRGGVMYTRWARALVPLCLGPACSTQG